MKTIFLFCFFLLLCCYTGIGGTSLDDFLVPFRLFRRFFMEVQLQEKQSNKSNFRRSKLQSHIPKSKPFPCDLRDARSVPRPKSVHELRPGDVDVVAALGDSLTAGIGVTAINPLELLLEERGKTFSIGGEGDWRTYLTLPNILKVFNPNLVGYALNTSLSIQEESQLNVAEAAAVSADMPYMAKQLIRRMNLDKKININEDWKMITIFIGANDFCNICYERSMTASLKQHRKDMIEVLQLLRNNLPRTVVNFVLPPHLKLLVELEFKGNLSCYLFHVISCPCLFGLPNLNKRQQIYDFMEEWRKVDMELCDLDEFDRDDFTVVVQPFLLNYTFPTISPEVPDLGYLSADCFHFSQKAHARVANDLWNNIMEPVGKKSVHGNKVFEKFNCPKQKNPYIFTRRNS